MLLLSDPLQALAMYAAVALAIVVFRAVPFVLWALLSPRAGLRAKLVAPAVFGAGVFSVWALGIDVSEIVVRGPLMFAYFAVVALLVHEARGIVARPLGKVGFAVALPFLYMVVPAVVGGAASLAAMLVVGWEMGLSAFSYAVSARGATRRDALFFLLVDPSLVYGDRARRDPSTGPRLGAMGGLRTVRGALELAAQQVALAAAALLPWLATIDLLDVAGWAGYSRFVGSHLWLGVTVYFAHAGLASTQIGMLRMAGFRVMERYARPYLAASPSDFWGRWNRWLGRWAKCYVYLPLASRAARRLRGRTRRLAIGGAAIATFGLIGVLHDLVPWTAGLAGGYVGRPFVMTWVFLAAGAMLVGWHFASRTRLLGRVHRSLPRGIGRGAQRLVFLHVVVLWLWLAMPAVTARELPRGLQPGTRGQAVTQQVTKAR